MLDYIKALVAVQRSGEKGVTAVEYAVMLVLVAIAVAGFGSGIADAVTGVFDDLIAALTPAP